ncbi:isoleucine--tRNA ligase [Pusillibacter faecalis]|uniref:Isoleucine--tRNA ligase n=1 Tax=Pusillibacter faecalis TaxID=2714358 RepID=A0A810Q7A6_9FIRM|nr:isoleucine--tRNA ligase [Pusillibacter faecalis]BCK84168.1 isoleucine--tRNA ligase [Pusillibacter faecalis]
MDYNKTINLPKTDFPMRAGLPKREPEMLARWKKIDVYGELLKKNEGKPRFSLHDGPPFSNGALHMGHALNKSIKDFITRSYAMRGYYTPYIPGWDNHGMPIESAIIKEQKLNRKAMSVPEFRSACHAYAQHYVDVQSEGFQRMGVVGDWAHPYLTMNPGFEAEEVKVFGAMYNKGYIYKGFKPVYWCPHDETALAEAEIEYQDDPCTTVYVKFPMHDDCGKLGGYDKLFFVIWTTTIWTLPGNLAIALHPDESYALVKAPNGEVYIMAEALTEKVMGVGGFASYEILETHPGSFFENMLADHPFLPKTSRLVVADYVTMDSGTGCVHTAPGFGADDYETCRRYGIDMVVPVDDQGRHTDYAGKYAGMKTEDSNPVILNDMKESGALFAQEDIVHSYPHCWRCKHPIIFRATPQWFCSVDSFKEEAVAACDDVRWVPGWGIDRIKAMVRERSDWCISRQRRWGLPIPVVYCKDCGKPVCTDETIAAISALFEKEGSNAWFAREAEEILPAGFTCPHCGGKSGFTKEEDTLDGWFDSGSTHFAAMKRDQGFWPANVYMEGLDQYRGWFQSSLLTAVGALGQGAPFKECITHGWTVDGEGKAMHKSLGNGMDPYEIFDKYGADLLRLWAASADYHADMRCSDGIFKQLSQNYLKFRNTARYCLGNLNGFDPDRLVAPEEMLELDRWAVTRLNGLIAKCFQAYDDYEFNAVTHAINDFCVVEMSNFYLDIIKDRLYCDETDGEKRRSAQTALFLILDTMTKIMAPILCFTCDEIWQVMPHRSGDDGRNVVFNEMNQPFAGYALDEAAMARWDRLIAVRDAVNGALEAARAEKKIGKALEAKVKLTVPAEDAFLAEMDAETLADLLIVSQAEASVGGGLSVSVEGAEGAKCERCWKQSPAVGSDPAHPTLCPRCAGVIAKSAVLGTP